MRAIPGPETVLVSSLPPSPNALTKSTIFVLGRLFNVEGQVFDPNEYPSNENVPQVRRWQGGYFALETDDGGLYFAVPPIYGRATELHHTGSILDVMACIREKRVVTIETSCILPPVEIQKTWEILPNAGAVQELLAVRTGDSHVIPEGEDQNIFNQLVADKLVWRLGNMLCLAGLDGETPYSLTRKTIIDAERAQSSVSGLVKSSVGEPEQLVLADF